MTRTARYRLVAQVGLTAVALAGSSAWADTTTAGIRGKVTDADGKPIEGASVHIRNVAFGTTIDLETNKSGKYLQLAIKPGGWDMSVRKDGYVEAQLQVTLPLGKKTKVDVVLNPAETGGETGGGGFLLGDIKLSNEAATAYQAAQEALAGNDQQSARGHLEEVVRLEPTLASVHFILAQVTRDLGDEAAAEKCLTTGLELDPGQVDGWLVLGELRSDAGRIDQALEAYAKASEAAPADSRPYAKLAMGLVMKQDFAGAVPMLEKYLELAPDAADAGQKRTLLAELRKIAQ